MKKPLLLLALLSAVFAAQAQTDKGDWMLGGSLGSVRGVIPVHSNSGSYVGFSVSPQAGYFVRNNFALGAAISIAPYFGTLSYINCGIQPFVRQYFGKRVTKPFVNATAGYSVYTTFGHAGEEDHGSFVNADIGGGLAHFITPNVALESTLHLQAVSDTKWEMLNLLPAVTFGFQIHLKSLKREKTPEIQVLEEEE